MRESLHDDIKRVVARKVIKNLVLRVLDYRDYDIA